MARYPFGLVERPWSTEQWGDSPPSLSRRTRALFVLFVLLPTVWWQKVMLPSNNMVSASGCRFGNRVLSFDPDSDPEQEISVWTGQHQGEKSS